MSTNELAIPFVYAGEILAAAILLPLLSILAVGTRFWLRRKAHNAGIGADDWTILCALFPVIGMGICLIYGVSRGAIGYPSPPYPVPMDPPVLEELYETTPQQTVVFKMDWAIWLLMVPGNGLIKLSALLLYRRIFVVNKHSVFDIVTKCMLVICVLWTVAFWFAQLFGCGSNVAYSYSILANIESCNTNTRLNALMISDLVTDCLVWAMPIPVVWRLHMGTGKKLSITGILSLAAMSLAAAVVRLIVELEIAGGGYAAHTDVNLTLSILLYWSMIESSLALIAACLPTLHFLVLQNRVKLAVHSVRRLLHTRSTTNNMGSTINGRTYQKFPDDAASTPSRRAAHESYELSRAV